MSIDVRLYREADLYKVVGMHNDIFGSNTSKNLFQWKYHRAPYGSRPNFVVAEEGSTIIGGIGEFLIPLRLEDKCFLARHFADVMIRKEYRGQGIFRRLVQTLYGAFGEGAAVEYGFPTPETQVIWKKVRDWSFCTYPLRLRINRPSSLGGLGNRKWLGRPVRAMEPLYQFALRFGDWIREVGEPTSMVRSCPGYKQSAFKAPPPSHARVHVRRDEKFWNWRAEDPGVRVKTYWAAGKNSPDAALLVATDSTGKTCKIALQSVPEGEEGTRALSAVYRQVFRDHMSAEMIEVPSTVSGELAGHVGITHDKWITRATESTLGRALADRLDVDLEYFQTKYTSQTVGWRWYENPDVTGADPPSPQEWEMSCLLRDWL